MPLVQPRPAHPENPGSAPHRHHRQRRRFQAVQERSGMTTFPQVFIDGSVIGGYDDLAAMQAAGERDALR